MPPAAETRGVRILDVYAVSDAVAFATVDRGDGVLDHDCSLLGTRDGGRSWQRQDLDIPPGSEVVYLRFVSPRIGWLVAVHTIESCSGPTAIFRTTDEGRTWTACALIPGYHGYELIVPSLIVFFDENRGTLRLANDSKLDDRGNETEQTYETTDGAATWKKVLDGPLAASEEASHRNREEEERAPLCRDTSWKLIEEEEGIAWAVLRTRDGGRDGIKVHTFRAR